MRVNIITLLFFAFILFIFLGAFGLSKDARFGPLVVGGAGLVLALFQILREILSKKSRKSSGRQDAHSGSSGSTIALKESHYAYLEIAACLVSLLVVINVIGLLFGFPLFVFAYLKLYHRSWLLSIVLAAIVFGLFYFVFGLVLKVYFYKGFLFE